eukprot:COSAG02_NODE_4024_length_5890_cov_2.925574_2_plen_61_part_00
MNSMSYCIYAPQHPLILAKCGLYAMLKYAVRAKATVRYGTVGTHCVGRGGGVRLLFRIAS